MSSAITKMKDTIERYRNAGKRIKETAKAGVHELVGSALAVATAGAVGAYDEAKGTSQTNDEGITTANIGPLPVSLVVAAVGKAGALIMLGDETGRLASSFGQGGADAWAYVMGRRLWKRHQASQ